MSQMSKIDEAEFLVFLRANEERIAGRSAASGRILCSRDSRMVLPSKRCNQRKRSVPLTSWPIWSR